MKINRRVFRIWQSAILMESRGRLRFFTLTVPEQSLSLREIANRWRQFCNTRWWRKLSKGNDYIIVYEPHPNGHGWHCHVLTNFFIPWQQLQLMANSVHFGHTDIEAVDNGASLYMAKYVTKAQVLRRADKSAKSVRIVNVSRRLLSLKDVIVSSPSIDFIRRFWDSVPGRKAQHKLRLLYFCWIECCTGVTLNLKASHYVRSGLFNV